MGRNRINIGQSDGKKEQYIFHIEQGKDLTDSLVQSNFEYQAEISPFKNAVICGEGRLSYKDLNVRSNQLARHFIKKGLAQGDVIGICLERSIDMIVTLMGVLKSGCCYLPLDPSFPLERIRYMFEDSGAKALVTQASLKDNYKKISDSILIVIDEENDIINSFSHDNPKLEINSQSLAYLIYTSGSTGRPKGVKVHHQAVVNFLNSMRKKPGFIEEDRLLAVTTLSFDISVLELFLPLFVGGELIVSSVGEIFNGQKIAGLLEKHDITIMQGAPATWNVLIGTGWGGKKNLKALCGGEALSSNLAGQLLPKVSELWNMYGPTETTVWSTCYQIKEQTSPVLIGKPIDNTTVYILDSYNKVLPVGDKGEVCIGGMGVSKGYHNRTEVNSEKFIQFEDGEVIYKTGDLGRYLSDGNIEIFGRIDSQIKLCGVRIEPGEIESLLSDIQGVMESVVKLHSFEENDDRIVAFLHISDEFKMTDGEINRELSKHLPVYMIPAFYQKCKVFPRMPNGKINRKYLVFKVLEPTDVQEKPDLFLSDTENRLITIWESVLRLRNISIYDNFFNIGGNSLLAIKVVNRMKEEFGINFMFNKLVTKDPLELALRFFFSSPRIKDIAEAIDVYSKKTRNE